MPRRPGRIAAPLMVALALLVPLILSAPAPAAQSDQDLINLGVAPAPLPRPHVERLQPRPGAGAAPPIPTEPDFVGGGLRTWGRGTTSRTSRCSGTGRASSRPRDRSAAARDPGRHRADQAKLLHFPFKPIDGTADDARRSCRRPRPAAEAPGHPGVGRGRHQLLQAHPNTWPVPASR